MCCDSPGPRALRLARARSHEVAEANGVPVLQDTATSSSAIPEVMFLAPAIAFRGRVADDRAWQGRAANHFPVRDTSLASHPGHDPDNDKSGRRDRLRPDRDAYCDHARVHRPN